jgi:hypothetical protein
MNARARPIDRHFQFEAVIGGALELPPKPLAVGGDITQVAKHMLLALVP